MRFTARALVPLLLIGLLASCSTPPPTEPAPASDSTPTAEPSQTPTAVTPLDPCALVTASDRIAVFGSDLGDGVHAENLRGESHQVFTTSGCTWSGGGLTVVAELTEPRDYPAAEVVCIAPIENAVTELPNVGDRAWTATVAAGQLVRACAVGGIADVTVSGSRSAIEDAAAIARVLLAAAA